MRSSPINNMMKQVEKLTKLTTKANKRNDLLLQPGMVVGKLVKNSSHSKQEIILDDGIDDILKNVNLLKIPSQVFNPHRLLILTGLDRFGALDFPSLRDGVLLNRSDGNIANHLRVLEDLELIKVEKTFVDRKPKTYYRLTTKGKVIVKDLAKQLVDIFVEKDDES